MFNVEYSFKGSHSCLFFFYNVNTLKAFCKEQDDYTSKEACSFWDNSVINAFILSGPRKLNYRRLEEGWIFFLLFKIPFLQPSYGILSFLTLKRNIETTCSLLQDKLA